jgi:hypothetical protein
MPSVTHVGVSQRIEEEAERERLKGLVQDFVTKMAVLFFAPLQKAWVKLNCNLMPHFCVACGIKFNRA